MQTELFMDSFDLPKSTSFTAEQLSTANQWPIEKWRDIIPKLSPDQIALILPLATPEQDLISWKDKTHAVIEILKTPQQLEAVGRAVSFEQIYEILSWITENRDLNQVKLFPLFVGISQELFFMLLMQASSAQQLLLKQESISEPIQHHLTLLTHALSTTSESQNQTFSNLEMQLESLNLAIMTPEQISEQENVIEFLRETCLNTQLVSSKALAIAWNSNRTDLIEKLSSIKEQSQKLSNLAIGHPKLQDFPATGLYAILENRLNSVFNDENNIPLSEDEPALEALVKFSIWYINDYWEVGLLPQISTTEKLQLNSESVTEQEQIDYRKDLFAIVEKNLEKIGLLTLKDLKKNKIYSKAALKNFIQSNLQTLLVEKS